MGILWTIIVVSLPAWLPSSSMPGDNEPSGFVLTTILGIVGAFGGDYLGQALGWYTPGEGAGLIGAVVGAIIVLLPTVSSRAGNGDRSEELDRWLAPGLDRRRADPLIALPTWTRSDVRRPPSASPAEAAVHCHAARTISVRTMTRADFDDQLGVGIDVAIGAVPAGLKRSPGTARRSRSCSRLPRRRIRRPERQYR